MNKPKYKVGDSMKHKEDLPGDAFGIITENRDHSSGYDTKMKIYGTPNLEIKLICVGKETPYLMDKKTDDKFDIFYYRLSNKHAVTIKELQKMEKERTLK